MGAEMARMSGSDQGTPPIVLAVSNKKFHLEVLLNKKFSFVTICIVCSLSKLEIKFFSLLFSLPAPSGSLVLYCPFGQFFFKELFLFLLRPRSSSHTAHTLRNCIA